MNLKRLYTELLEKYGPQGWWPINNKYHPREYNIPKNKNEIFEVCVGAILTQNTSWKNVQKALDNLYKKKLLTPGKILKTKKEVLRNLIRPAGYYNQKTEYLIEFTKYYLNKKGIPAREELLNIKGVGPETADSILLYAYKQPFFVIDAYTKRLLNMKEKSYDELQRLFQKELPQDYKLYQEYHALS